MELELPEEGVLGIEFRPLMLIPLISERDLAKLRHPSSGGVAECLAPITEPSLKDG